MTDKIDLSRMNRHERRRIGKMLGGKIMGRNLPYIKEVHGDLENYYKLREKEIESDNKR